MSIETAADLAGLREVGRVVALTLREVVRSVRPGITTAELDAIGAAILARHGARSAPQLFYGFPGVLCISLNDEAVHGIPGPRAIQPGDLVKIDVTAERGGYVADAAITVPVEPVAPAARALCACATRALQRAIAVARAGRPITDIGRTVEAEVTRSGFSVMRGLNGHGVGRRIHEPPEVPNYAEPRLRRRLTDGLVITIEPVVAVGGGEDVVGRDGWTISTADGSLSAHYEHTIVVTRGRPLVLTAA